jgi:hypothetical protein
LTHHHHHHHHYDHLLPPQLRVQARLAEHKQRCADASDEAKRRESLAAQVRGERYKEEEEEGRKAWRIVRRERRGGRNVYRTGVEKEEGG